MTSEERIKRAFSKASDNYNANAFVQQRMAEHLATLLPEGDSFARAFEFGVGTGLLTTHIDARCRVSSWLLNDLSEEMLRNVPPLQGKATFLPGNVLSYAGDERLTGLNLITSSAALQWIPEPFSLLQRLSALLEPGGILLIGTFRRGNLNEIASLTGNTLPYFEENDLERFARSAGLRILSLTSKTMRLSFPSPREVLRHLKSTGTTQLPQFGNKSFRLDTKSALARFDEAYRATFPAPQGQGVALSYIPLYLCAVKE